MSRRPLRPFAKTKSPFVRGLVRKNTLIVPAKAPGAEHGERGEKFDAFESCLPDVSGGFLPPEALFLFDAER